MIRRLPLLPTLLVLVAVGMMARLGFWQLDRLHQKEALLARYQAAQAMSAEVPWSGDPRDADALLYRHVRVDCAKAVGAEPVAGRSASNQLGWAQIHTCTTRQGFSVRVVIGWAKQPYAGLDAAGARTRWSGGLVTGVLAPGPRLVAIPPLARLEANAPPDPATVPNSHLAYAVQWFLFAATALVIYAIVAWRRMKGK
jgi:cytochrome oxidase assembly protein ShyY1